MPHALFFLFFQIMSSVNKETPFFQCHGKCRSQILQ